MVSFTISMTDEQKHVYDARTIRQYARMLDIDEAEAQRLSPEELYSRVRATYRQAGLTYREREILNLRLGTGDGIFYTLEEVGRIFKVTRERVRQVEAKAIRKLKGFLEESL